MSDKNEIKHGHWINYGAMFSPEGLLVKSFDCSVCKQEIHLPLYYGSKCNYRYCPMCGSIMDEEGK